MPDWLRELRTNDADEPSQYADTPPEAEPDDWLTRIQTRSQKDNPTAAQSPEPDDVPDWLQGLQDSATAAEQPDAPNRAEEQPSSGQETPSPFAASANETPAWLQDNSAGEDDWLNTLNTPPTEPASGAADLFGAEGGMQWSTSDAATDEPSITAQPDDQRPTKGFGMTDFLANFEGTDTQPSTGGMDELSAFNSQNNDSPVNADLPDWFQSTSQDAPPSPEQATDADLPDWMRSISPMTAEDDTPAMQPDAEQPTWLQPANADSKDPLSSAMPAEGAELPDWMQSQTLPTEQTPAQEPPAQPQTSQPAADAEMPDWLTGLTAAAPIATDAFTPSSSAETFASSGDTPSAPWDAQASPVEPLATTPEGQDADGLPDWFASLEQSDETGHTQPLKASAAAQQFSETDEPSADSASEADLTTENEIPGWMRAFHEPQPAETELPSRSEPANLATEDEETLFPASLPDWLAEENPANATNIPADGAQIPAAQPADLARAELPDWVQDMRPIETMIPGAAPTGEMDQRVEKAGPLAGMRGVVPAEELASRYNKPPVYSVKLRVTDKQRKQADLFETILTQEAQPLQLPAARSHAAGLLLRAVIAVLLLAALAIPFLPGSPIHTFGLPALYPSEMLHMYETIEQNTIPNDAVLLAVDYEPALSGEMRMAALPVVEQLMAKNARIVVISTVPTGPALAQQLLEDASNAVNQKGQTKYSLEDQTINLGYLPGGTISLLEFARQPQIAIPVTNAGTPAWSSSILADVTGLNDFTQMVILTDRAETGRAWIEQVQPVTRGVPMLMVTSAQAAPLMTPYMESGQVTGMVSGLLGGAMYAQLAGEANSLAGQHLASYQIGIVLAFIFVLVGGVVSGGMALFRRKDNHEE